VNRHHAELVEQRDQAVRDLAELEGQLAAGEIEPGTAEELRRRYEADAAAALRALRRAAAESPPGATDQRGRPARRRLATAGVLTVAVGAAAAVALPTFLADRPEGGYVTGNEVAAGNAPDGRDLAEVTTEEMEAVVAQNPDVVPMRRRLAHRYLDAGEFKPAVEHYLAVLERGPDVEAMSHLGWIVASDGRVDLGVELLERARELAPDDAESMWFLANIRLYLQGDAVAAIDLLEALVGRDDLGDRREQVEEALADARAAIGDGR
jgi:tetratricopeptide (TPR) repeat protein